MPASAEKRYSEEHVYTTTEDGALLEGADHSYTGHETEVAELLARFIEGVTQDVKP